MLWAGAAGGGGEMKRSTNLNRAHRALSVPAADLVAALGLSIDDLYPVFDLLLPDGSVVQQRGVSGTDAAQRYYRLTGIKPAGYRRSQG